MAIGMVTSHLNRQALCRFLIIIVGGRGSDIHECRGVLCNGSCQQLAIHTHTRERQ